MKASKRVRYNYLIIGMALGIVFSMLVFSVLTLIN